MTNLTRRLKRHGIKMRRRIIITKGLRKDKKHVIEGGTDFIVPQIKLVEGLLWMKACHMPETLCLLNSN